MGWATALITVGIGWLVSWVIVEIIYAMRGPDDHETEDDWVAERRRRIEQRGQRTRWGARDGTRD